MKVLALALLLLTANDTLVGTAKTAKANRRKSTGKVLTNADVRKSKGKIGQTSATAPLNGEPEESLVDKQESMRKARREYDSRSAAARAAVAQLEKEVVALEQAYYDEHDLDRRDGELVRRFNEATKKLDAAREELAKIEPVT
jgi:DNA repair ATPase RecN